MPKRKPNYHNRDLLDELFELSCPFVTNDDQVLELNRLFQKYECSSSAAVYKSRKFRYTKIKYCDIDTICDQLIDDFIEYILDQAEEVYALDGKFNTFLQEYASTELIQRIKTFSKAKFVLPSLNSK